MEKLAEALRLVKIYCKQSSCEDCPMCTDNGDCAVNASIPEDWIIETRILH